MLLLQKLRCRVGEEVKYENWESNELIKVKLPPQKRLRSLNLELTTLKRQRVILVSLLYAILTRQNKAETDVQGYIARVT